MRQKRFQQNKTLICGLRSCQEVLKSPSAEVLCVYLVEGKNYPDWVQQIDHKLINYVTKDFLTRLVNNSNLSHQDICMETIIKQTCTIPELCSIDGAVVILDNVTDPHNVGAIIRSAAVFGIKGIIIHGRSACGISSTVAKTSSGGLNYVTICPVNNIAATIKELKKYGFWIVALSECGDKYLHEVDLHGKICLIFGSESTGIRRLQMKNSDFIARLPTTSHFSTLNVSNAASIAFYELARQNEFKMG